MPPQVMGRAMTMLWFVYCSGGISVFQTHLFSFTGYGPGYDDVVVHGDLHALKFVAYYTK